VVFVYGFERLSENWAAGDYGVTQTKRFWNEANLQRDVFPIICPYPLVFWLAPPDATHLAQHAGDLWHWRTTSINLEDPVEAADPFLKIPHHGSVHSPHVSMDIERVFQQARRLYRALIRQFSGSKFPPLPRRMRALLSELESYVGSTETDRYDAGFAGRVCSFAAAVTRVCGFDVDHQRWLQRWVGSALHRMLLMRACRVANVLLQRAERYKMDDPSMAIHAVLDVAQAMRDANRNDEAFALLNPALQLARQKGDQPGTAWRRES
jgi:hypothetical protein